jgi:hypothetical protein
MNETSTAAFSLEEFEKLENSDRVNRRFDAAEYVVIGRDVTRPEVAWVVKRADGEGPFVNVCIPAAWIPTGATLARLRPWTTVDLTKRYRHCDANHVVDVVRADADGIRVRLPSGVQVTHTLEGFLDRYKVAPDTLSIAKGQVWKDEAGAEVVVSSVHVAPEGRSIAFDYRGGRAHRNGRAEIEEEFVRKFEFVADSPLDPAKIVGDVEAGLDRPAEAVCNAQPFRWLPGKWYRHRDSGTYYRLRKLKPTRASLDTVAADNSYHEVSVAVARLDMTFDPASECDGPEVA